MSVASVLPPGLLEVKMHHRGRGHGRQCCGGLPLGMCSVVVPWLLLSGLSRPVTVLRRQGEIPYISGNIWNKDGSCNWTWGQYYGRELHLTESKRIIMHCMKSANSKITFFLCFFPYTLTVLLLRASMYVQSDPRLTSSTFLSIWSCFDSRLKKILVDYLFP